MMSVMRKQNGRMAELGSFALRQRRIIRNRKAVIKNDSAKTGKPENRKKVIEKITK